MRPRGSLEAETAHECLAEYQTFGWWRRPWVGNAFYHQVARLETCSSQIVLGDTEGLFLIRTSISGSAVSSPVMGSSCECAGCFSHRCSEYDRKRTGRALGRKRPREVLLRSNMAMSAAGVDLQSRGSVKQRVTSPCGEVTPTSVSAFR